MTLLLEGNKKALKTAIFAGIRALCYGGAGTNRDYTIQVCRSKAKAGRVDELRTFLMTQNFKNELDSLTKLAILPK
jgi:hypothetical protein